MKKSLFNLYKKFLPITDKTPEVTLGEGFTPLVKSKIYQINLIVICTSN